MKHSEKTEEFLRIYDGLSDDSKRMLKQILLEMAENQKNTETDKKGDSQ